MKKIGLALLILLFTGCMITKVDDGSFDNIVDTILYKDVTLINTSFEGYKFYRPRGMTVKEKKEYNLEIKDDKNSYYLYVDTIAYYYKTKLNHEVENNIFYSKNLSYKDKFGYIDISKVEDKYFVEVMYNYAKIEAYLDEDNLYDGFINICYILSSIKFNDSAIEYRLSNKKLETKSEEFNIFNSKKSEDNFLKYVEEFDKYENGTAKDQDIIETDDD